MYEQGPKQRGLERGHTRVQREKLGCQTWSKTLGEGSSSQTSPGKWNPALQEGSQVGEEAQPLQKGPPEHHLLLPSFLFLQEPSEQELGCPGVRICSAFVQIPQILLWDQQGIRVFSEVHGDPPPTRLLSEVKTLQSCIILWKEVLHSQEEPDVVEVLALQVPQPLQRII